jgi:hypothetical protein
MKYALIVFLLLSGCSTTVPVVAKFPKAPSELVERCPDLIPLVADAKLSDVAKSIVNNYTLYYQCSVKIDAWNEWYESQKKLFEELK